MNFNQFNLWLIEHYGFNAFENAFFEKALYNAYNGFATTSINDVPLPVLYQNNLFEEVLNHYKTYLGLLLRQTAELAPNLSLTVEGICLNDLRPQLKELQQKVSLLGVVL
jgi:hypothetical protein